MFQINHAMISDLKDRRAAEAAALANTDAQIALAYGPAVGKICSLLLSMFSADEIRRLFSYTPGLGASACAAMPEQGSAKEVGTAAAVAALDLNAVPQLLAAMAQSRQNRRGDVDRLRAELDAL